MPDQISYLREATEAIQDVGNISSQIDQVLKQGEKQANVRADVIKTVNTMCDALQLACDLISREISASIVEFNAVQEKKGKAAYHSFFRRTAERFTDASIGRLLHEGQVCGALHALGDAFQQPFSPQAIGGLHITETVRTFFTRSNSMSRALQYLHQGERTYLHSVIAFMADVRDRAENAASTGGDVGQLRQNGSELVGLMQKKRRAMQEQVWELRDAADRCVERLH